ncbi:MAG: hypothetical protein K2H85_09295 [Allobaculum sp.]|nr:hypothetical protein [Allobaculum sp.]
MFQTKHPKRHHLGEKRNEKSLKRNFKELLESDLEIFFNLNELAEIHRIEGYEMPCVLMTESAGSTSTTADKDLQRVGLFGADTTLYVKKENCPFKYSARKILNVDGKEMQIRKVAEESGVMIFNLAQYRGY